jgi:predicted lipid-binding transport protein (Tim44 family)
MSNNQDGSTPSCATTCWGAGALVGVVLAGVLMFAAGWSFFGAVLIGVVAFGLVGGIMSYTLCRELPEIGAAKPAAAPKPSAAPAPEPAPAPKAEPAPAAPKEPAAAKAPEPEAAEPKGTILPGEADLAARKGTWRYAPEADTAEAPAAEC